MRKEQTHACTRYMKARVFQVHQWDQVIGQHRSCNACILKMSMLKGGVYKKRRSHLFYKSNGDVENPRMCHHCQQIKDQLI